MHFQLMKTYKQGLTQQLHWYRDCRKQVNQCLRTKYRSKLNPNVYIKIAFVKGVYRTISKRKNSISNGNKWHFKFCHNKKKSICFLNVHAFIHSFIGMSFSKCTFLGLTLLRTQNPTCRRTSSKILFVTSILFICT